MSEKTIARKDHHLDLCAQKDVESLSVGSLFDDVHLIHRALTNLGPRDLDTRTSLFGKSLSLPIMFTAITGGTARGRELNRALGPIAQSLGIALGVGSQRAMGEHPEVADSFFLRDVAPDAVIVGNIGLWQAKKWGVEGVIKLMEAIGADGMAIHLNVAQELVQPEGDRDFSDGMATLEKLAEALGDRLLVKETGCGISPLEAMKLQNIGVKTLDLSGLGGTSWIKVEAQRIDRSQERFRRIAECFSDWGIPTAPCVASVRQVLGREIKLIASGGIRTGLDGAKALALGADLVGVALPLLRAWEEGEASGLRDWVGAFVDELRMAMALSGARDLGELKESTVVEGSEFSRWKASLLKEYR